VIAATGHHSGPVAALGAVATPVAGFIAHRPTLLTTYVISAYGALFATDEQWGRMRHLDPVKFDKRGKPLLNPEPPAGSALHGTHPERWNRRGRVTGVGLAVLGILIAVAFGALPLINLPAAWLVVAVYVLAGSLATVGRLVPVRTS
jgi:hypothetical protein